MERYEILDIAKDIVTKDRNEQYGSPENNFNQIAEYWSNYLGTKINDHDVAIMMILLKIARIKTGSPKADNYIDIAGYASCGGEIILKANNIKD